MKIVILLGVIFACLIVSIESRSRSKHRPSSHNRHKTKFHGWKIFNDDKSTSNSTSHQPASHSSPIVHTSWATIEGTIETHSGVNISTFYGIPFAEPPVGELRFRLPVKLKGRYHGVYNATAPKPACMQLSANNKTKSYTEPSSEDCLFLNIWVPREDNYEHQERRSSKSSSSRDHWDSRKTSRQRSSSRGYPVLFYIYGGQFIKYSATSPEHRGGVTAALGKLVFVNANYRLGALGFAYGHDRYMPGNQAVHDILTALEWVRKNIASFGGDPDRITLSGSSSGADIAGMLAISPKVDPALFGQLFLMSAVPMRPTVIESRSVALNKTKALSTKLGCSDSSSESFEMTIDQIECLRKTNASDIAEIGTSEDIIMLGSCPNFAFMPIYGDDFMPFPTDVYLQKGQIRRHLKLLIGSDKFDDVLSKNYEPSSRKEAEEYLDNFITNMVKPKQNISNQLDYIHDYYFDGVADDNIFGLKERMSSALGDLLFQCPVWLFIEKWALVNQVNYYFNNYTSAFNSNKTEARYQHGPIHGDANFFFLGEPFTLEESFSDHDRYVSYRMIKILSDFVSSGEVNWPPVLVSKSKILPLEWIIDERVDTHNVRVNPKLNICRFWNKLFQYFNHSS